MKPISPARAAPPRTHAHVGTFANGDVDVVTGKPGAATGVVIVTGVVAGAGTDVGGTVTMGAGAGTGPGIGTGPGKPAGGKKGIDVLAGVLSGSSIAVT